MLLENTGEGILHFSELKLFSFSQGLEELKQTALFLLSKIGL
jgi:hypothetical protein